MSAYRWCRHCWEVSDSFMELSRDSGGCVGNSSSLYRQRERYELHAGTNQRHVRVHILRFCWAFGLNFSTRTNVRTFVLTNLKKNKSRELPICNSLAFGFFKVGPLEPTLRSRSATLPRFVPMVCAVEPSSLQGSARHLTQTIKEQIKLEGKSVRK